MTYLIRFGSPEISPKSRWHKASGDNPTEAIIALLRTLRNGALKRLARAKSTTTALTAPNDPTAIHPSGVPMAVISHRIELSTTPQPSPYQVREKAPGKASRIYDADSYEDAEDLIAVLARSRKIDDCPKAVKRVFSITPIHQIKAEE